MARRLFFVPWVRGGKAELRGDDAQHLTRVLRVERGQVYQIADGSGAVYLAEVTQAHKGLVEFDVRERQPEPAPLPDVTLLAALVKFDAFEWMIEKATELGAARIVPVLAARSEHGLERAVGKKLERWRKIALEASQQSRRVTVPDIGEPIAFSAALAWDTASRLFANEAGGTSLIDVPLQAPAAVLIGPEGGWTSEEREAASNWTQISLGPLILRAETAASTALAIVTARLR